MTDKEKEYREYNLELLSENDKLRHDNYHLKSKLERSQRDYKLLNKLFQTISEKYSKLMQYVERVNKGKTDE